MGFGRVLSALISDTVGRHMRADAKTHGLMIIPTDHYEVHEGSMFRVGTQVDLASGAATAILLHTPNSDVEQHLMVTIGSEQQSRYELVEGITDSGGTAATPANANRRSSATSGITAKTGITFTGGTTLENVVIGGQGQGANTGPIGEARSDFEWILKKDTKYGIRVTNLESSNNDVNIRCSWYEHTPRD